MARQPQHPIVFDSNAVHCMSLLTGLSYDELLDQELLWFIYRGRMTPRPTTGHFDRGDGHYMQWECRGLGMCGFVSGRGRGGSRALRDAVRQHLRDKHGLVRPKPRVVTSP